MHHQKDDDKTPSALIVCPLHLYHVLVINFCCCLIVIGVKRASGLDGVGAHL